MSTPICYHTATEKTYTSMKPHLNPLDPNFGGGGIQIKIAHTH